MAFIFFLVFLFSCSLREKPANSNINDVAGNEEVLNFMKTFEGRGDLSDSGGMLSPHEALARFTVPGDLALDLVLAEPQVTQPVFMTFDPRGRLWVVQYNQYPYPEGLKVVSMDQHVRAKFDKVPLPPPNGVKGADKLTVFEDTNGDGTFDKSTDVIDGLNIITSVAFGRGRIWVLNPPYLLAYPDADHDGIPDGPPVVHLKGFGIEDTHAVANNLRFGPDGWLYGAQGSTCNADVSSPVSKNVVFHGQAIWRYHPDTQVFEVFAEGGGNTFDIEIDDKGRLYSGDNGVARGQYYKQGAYFIRNLGKHGEYTNPYAFGHLPNMELNGEETRFTHSFVKYSGGALPTHYKDRMIALNPLQGYVQLSRFEPKGSTFRTVDETRIMTTNDHWFRPVDITTGPDGNVYIADWYDSRISHVDPRDTWNKGTGRIYRIRAKGSQPGNSHFNLYKSSDAQLLALISHNNIWYRQQALQVLQERKNKALLTRLMEMLQSGDGNAALNALWLINMISGINDDVAGIGLQHSDPFVRMWTIRLLGDKKSVSSTLSLQLERAAASEAHAEVRSQLAATAKRLPFSTAIPIIKNLITYHDDSHDPDIPLQLWWGMESVCEQGRDQLLILFEDKKIWSRPVISTTILNRLVQRYIIAGGSENISACARLFELAPSNEHVSLLFDGLQEGLRGRDISSLPPVMLEALKPYKHLFREHSIALDIRMKNSTAINKALQVTQDPAAKLSSKLIYIKLFSEIEVPQAVPVLLGVVESNGSSPALKQAALLALENYDNDDIGKRVVKAYPDKLRADYDVREAAMSLFASRSKWAMELLDAISRERKPGEQFVARTIDKSDVPDHTVRQLKYLNVPNVSRLADQLWPGVRLSTAAEKNRVIASVKSIVNSGSGDPDAGRAHFIAKCGSCHKLFDEGRAVGPDLTGYDRDNIDDMLSNTVDPSAYIREGYTAWHLVTATGRNIIGTIVSKRGKSLTIQPLTGEPVTVDSLQLKRMDPLKISIMPDGLLDNMTEKQLRDLFSYLRKKAG